MSTTRATDLPDILNDQLRGIVDGLASRSGSGHAVVAVEGIDGSFRWTRAAGAAHAGGPPMEADTPVFIASIDKMYVAITIMQLREEGLVALDDPIARFLDPSLIQGIHRLDGVDRSAQITVWHLLAHTSGLADWLEDYPRGGKSLVEQVVEHGDAAMDLYDILMHVRTRLTPRFPPQSLHDRRPRLRYCDTGYLLLIGIIESATGQPIQDVYEERIFRPLGLTRTFVAGQDVPVEPASLFFGETPLDIPKLMQSMSAIYSTAGEMVTVMRALVQGDLLSKKSFQLMTQSWHRFGFPLDRAALRAPSWPIEYGLGIMRFRLPRALTPFSPVPAVIGHTGSTGCWLFFCPEMNLLLSGAVDQATAGAVPFRAVPKILRVLRRAGL